MSELNSTETKTMTSVITLACVMLFLLLPSAATAQMTNVIYGVASSGGAHNGGTLFAFNHDGGYLPFYRFGRTLVHPGRRCVKGPDGKLYNFRNNGNYK